MFLTKIAPVSACLDLRYHNQTVYHTFNLHDLHLVIKIKLKLSYILDNRHVKKSSNANPGVIAELISGQYPNKCSESISSLITVHFRIVLLSYTLYCM